MPFTISHIAIVLPFTCKQRPWLSVTGLMIGAMVPDFFYFVLFNPYFNDGHRWSGIFLYDVPLALVLAFLYHEVAKPALIRYLPGWAGARLHHFRDFRWRSYFSKNYGAVVLSIVLGVLTHFFLDGFTHGHGFFVQRIPFLQGSISLFGEPMEIWYGMQYLTSVAGLLLLGWFFRRLPQPFFPSEIQGKHKPVFWLLTAVIASMILLLYRQQPHVFEKSMDYLAIVMGAVFYGFFAVVLGQKLLR
ncbi:DUF4184 family protein [Chitinophaga qingshengii]|uniref:DUF4184 family protein n=1 Tax=Chitinophaga qingshengii TaxID=1569794 RepID=A0ABR7TM07_9BACT|nr:DUF4184 family protein [Chitinophaga qingshengii]MBC9931008.1 DUF4184 family protein [Chitinophaga qingshengii]